MTTLVLRLAGPLQSWGSRSRFVRRDTELQPTKSGVIGMLAAACGVRRTDDLTDFFGLRFGVRTEQPGQLVRDFQTAQRSDGRPLPLSFRYYLGDAVFLAVVEGEQPLIESLNDAVRSPTFPLYLGRRSCPPAGPIALGLRDGTIQSVLKEEPWRASARHQGADRTDSVRLAIARDAERDEVDAEVIRDEPLSFDPRRREYGWRLVIRDYVVLAVDGPELGGGLEHDPMAAVGG